MENNNLINFIKKYETYFLLSDTVQSINNKKDTNGWLYIFKASCNENNTNQIFNIDVDKFGQTVTKLYKRLKQYKSHSSIRNIESINCSLSDKRERLIKGFLKYKLNIKPYICTEYFIGCRTLIKVLMLLFVFISDRDINIYNEFYVRYNKIEFMKFFNKISDYIKEIEQNAQYNIDTNNIKQLNQSINEEELFSQKKEIHTCIYCKNSYNSLSSLNYHQRTTKFCLQLQNNETNSEIKFICEYCNKHFLVKQSYSSHISGCKLKNERQQLENNLKKELQRLKDENDKLKHENEKLKLIIHIKDEQTNKHNKYTSVINNNNDNRKTQYNIQFNQLFEKLDILNESNVNKRINTINTQEQIREYDVSNFTSEFIDKLIDVFKDLTFCTDQSRKTVVYKDEDSNSVKMSVEELLTKCLQLGSDGFRTHFTLTEQIVDDRINNDDQTLTSEMLDNFEEQIKELKQFILDNKNSIDLKDKKNPLKKFAIQFIRSIEQHNKNPQLKLTT